MFTGLLQPTHLILILLIVLVVFGAGKLGSVGGALGQSVKEFKNNVTDGEEENTLVKGETVKAVAPGVEPVRAETQTVTVVRPTMERPAESLRREEI